MRRHQRGYINLDGFFGVMAVLSVFGIFGIIAMIFWGIPAVWSWIKPWLHMVTA